MMAVYKTPHQLGLAMKAKAESLRKMAVKSSHDAAVYMIRQARSRAPVHTGETIRGIRKRKKGKGYIVVSRVGGSFKHNLWANQTKPFRTVNMRWGQGRGVVYGDGSHRTTGTPRFFHIATNMTKRKFHELVRTNTGKALRVRV